MTEARSKWRPTPWCACTFSAKLTLGGISRAATVDVVAGTVKPDNENKVVIRKAAHLIEPPRVAVVAPAKPKPKPTPTVVPKLIKGIELIAPRQGTQLVLDKGTLVPQKPVSFTWRVSPSDRSVQFTLWKLGSPKRDATRTRVFQDTVSDKAGQGVVNFTLDSPGSYEWELRGPKGEPIRGVKRTAAVFTLDPSFEAIVPLEPLVGGELLSSSRLSGRQLKNFDITLRWDPYPGARKYVVSVKTKANAGKPVIEKLVAQSQYQFNKDRVYSGQIFFEVSAPLKNGFVAHSPLKPFVFTFLAPALVVPANHAVITAETLENEGDTILITWQKTNFTDWYELEVAKDADFKTVVQRKKLKENYFLFKSPEAAKYFWHVRSSTKSVVSPYSLSNDLTVQR